MNTKIKEMIPQLLTSLGENPQREGLRETPRRVAESMDFLCSGYNVDREELLNGALFESEANDIVIVRDIELFSMCEHHMLPFYGKCHVAYIPKKKIIGLSKIPRIVDMFARRLQVQERLCRQVASCLMEVLDPEGVAVVIEAHHLCMMMRGVGKQNSSAVTSTMLGAFRDNSATRKEVIDLLHR